MSFHLGDFYNTFTDGDALTTYDLNEAAKRLGPLYDGLKELGPKFHFAAQEVGRVLWRVTEMQQARKGEKR